MAEESNKDLPTDSNDESKSKQPDTQANDDAVKVKVVNQDGGETVFKIKTTSPLEKLMSAYASRAGVNLSTLRFLFDGQRLRDGDTVASLGMQEDDVIDVVFSQTGGLSCFFT